MKTKLLLLAVLIFTTGCGKEFSVIPDAGAQAPMQQPDPDPLSPCKPAMTYPATCVEHASANYLSISAVGGDTSPYLNHTYTLQHAMNLQDIDAWIGTAAAVLLETSSTLSINTPDGRYYEFHIQLDKHVDTIGSIERNIPVHLSLPAGTVLLLVVHGLQQHCGLPDPVFGPTEDCSVTYGVTFRLYGQ